jgi:6-phosphofructokinase 1
VIGTSRTNPYKVDGGVDRVIRHFAEAGLDALVAIGGEDTLGVACAPLRGVRAAGRRRPEDDRQRPLGDRLHLRLRHAVAICTEAIDRLHTTAESHNRVMVVEVMGRHTGWIAVMSGIAAVPT